MKKAMLVLSIIGTIGFIVLQLGNRTTVADAEKELQTLASVLQDEDILINDWSLHAREQLEIENHEQVLSSLNELKLALPNWEWTVTKDSQQWKAQAINNTPHYQENISIISTLTNHHAAAYVMYEVKGQSWNDHVESFLNKQVESRLFDIFRGNVTTFSCIKGEISDKIDTAISSDANRFLSAFQAHKIEALEEESFISVSASSPMFSASIGSNYKDMNLQLGLRKTEGLGGKTTIVVGTPIITIEY
ncbi:YwmB family TATA-box binding protein [Mesobacillus harenae]|uniref:YwmB family TATA-box binding protein n=1 Tax=Mesobacillus harenae TaxID=2213203 RepID=UPI0015806C12|nr:YwmB family TATA-box binding protein [Mesobacillus harenae]